MIDESGHTLPIGYFIAIELHLRIYIYMKTRVCGGVYIEEVMLALGTSRSKHTSAMFERLVDVQTVFVSVNFLSDDRRPDMEGHH